MSQGRVAQASDLAGITNRVGATSFTFFAKGGSRKCLRNFDHAVRSRNARVVGCCGRIRWRFFAKGWEGPRLRHRDPQESISTLPRLSYHEPLELALPKRAGLSVDTAMHSVRRRIGIERLGRICANNNLGIGHFSEHKRAARRTIAVYGHGFGNRELLSERDVVGQRQFRRWQSGHDLKLRALYGLCRSSEPQYAPGRCRKIPGSAALDRPVVSSL
jgi:hypothetical protein